MVPVYSTATVYRPTVDDKRQAQHTPVVIAEILKEEGMSSLYRGWRPVITSLWLSNFVYFYTFNGLKLFLVDSMRTRKALKDLLMGISAGIVNVLSTTPMWVVNTRLKMQGVHFKTERIEKKKFPKYSGIIDAFQKIISQEGVSTLWSGTVSSLALVINPALHFMIYESLKRPHLLFIFSSLVQSQRRCQQGDYPLQVIQSKLRYGRDNTEDGEKKPTMLDIFKYILQTQGRNGFYKGLETKLVQTVLTAALMFVCYEKIAAFIFRILGANLTEVKT
ncbi:putative peroxisomal membrane protein PMP34 [Apostichopus japonicus]|uniref:Putative peroxisomal membrane protein PMP34 n=1 Tax=Stichopus japonicus TaxID=307972 RepID=A0A2G8K8T1_STIJA|nr:putative peroxisomal membrane protein PMP34 [Apostichopus japonicus]